MTTLRPAQPPLNSPIAGGALITPVWGLFFSDLTGPPHAIQEISLTGSPFSYMATLPGTFLVRGGTVSAINLTRGRVTIAPLGFTAGLVPLGVNDVLEIVYSVDPDVWFIPY